MTKLYLEDSGSGKPTVVFLHYFGGSAGTWKPVRDLLKDEFRCIAVDLPGFGHSADADVPDYDVSTSALMLGNSLSGINAGEFILVAHSMGGKIALQYAGMQPAGLAAMILVAGSPPEPEPMTEEDRQAMIDMYGKARTVREHLQKISHQSFPDDVLNALAADNLRTNQTAWTYWMEKGSREDISDSIRDFNLPLTLLAGEFDKPLTTAYMKELKQKYFPDASVHEIPNCGHLIPVEAPLELAGIIRNVVAKIF